MLQRKLIKRLIGIIPALFFGYLSVSYFFQTDPQLLTGYSVSKDVMFRRSLLVDFFNQHPFPEEEVSLKEPQKKGLRTLKAYAYATYALTNIAMMSPETSYQASQVISEWIERCFKEEVYYFDQAAWNEIPVRAETIKSDEGHMGYYAYLHFMIGCYSLLNESGAYEDFYKVLTDGIAARLEKYKHHYAESFPLEIVSSDNTLAAASLKLADMVLGTDHAPLIGAWLEEVKRIEAESPDGILPPAIDVSSGKAAGVPRGSAAAEQLLFLSLIDKDFSKKLFQNYQRKAGRRILSFYAFQEYPEGEKPFGEDSTFEIFGFGFEATALALAPVRRERNEALARRIMRSLELCGVSLSRQMQRRYVMFSILQEAQILAARTVVDLKPLWEEE